MSDDKNLMDHEYDGIKELDNPLPDWWLFTFLITIIFGYLYFLHYQYGGGQTIANELASDMKAIEATKKNNPGKGDSEEELTQLLASAAAIDEGRSVFGNKCAACHGPQLQGLIGPNLTDEFWLHGKGKPVDIVQVIRKGVPDKGMPPWEGLLKDSEIKAVTVFVASERGSNPPNPKAPQGEKIVSQ